MKFSFTLLISTGLLLFQSCTSSVSDDIYYYLPAPCEIMPKNLRSVTAIKIKNDTAELFLLSSDKIFDKIILSTGMSLRYNKKSKIKIIKKSGKELSVSVQLPIGGEDLMFKKDEKFKPFRLNENSLSKSVIKFRIGSKVNYIMLPEFGSTSNSEGKFMTDLNDTLLVKHWETTNMKTSKHYDRIYMRKNRDTTLVLMQDNLNDFSLYLVNDWKLNKCTKLDGELVVNTI